MCRRSTNGHSSEISRLTGDTPPGQKVLSPKQDLVMRELQTRCGVPLYFYFFSFLCFFHDC